MGTSTAPHVFEPLGWTDRIFKRHTGRCRGCLAPRGDHPEVFWSPARAIGDRRYYSSREVRDMWARGWEEKP